jgi:hypothetical protein
LGRLAGAPGNKRPPALLAEQLSFRMAHSFKGQANSRLERVGYSAVRELKKDEQGVWRGKANFGGKPVDVSVDYRGAITRY